ncbi:MAG: phosphoglycerate kinase, partial [Thermoguttaceae bacterium]|nr:phosphoglycerate kinase [Thermoguttaceae bacterium]
DYLKAIPTLDDLADVPRGTPVLVRGDVDAKPGAKVGEGDIRLRSMAETLKVGRQRGWIQVIFGHIGRDPKGSLEKVRKRIGEILDCPVGFVADWLDPDTLTIKAEAAAAVRSAKPGDVIVLENTRKYPIETALWKLKPAGIPDAAPKMAKLANEYADKIAKVYVNEAFSAGSLDASTVVVPAAMDRVALGNYVADQFRNPLMDCLDAQLVISSGLKIDKLDDLEAMINRGKIRWVFTAGSLANGLKKAAAELEGKTFSIGVAEDASHSDKPYYIPRERIEQAKKLIAEGRRKGIEFVIPVDFVLQDGRISAEIGPGDQQLDIGPATSELFEKKIGEFLEKTRGQPHRVAFHNGVFGMFEDPRFEGGTKRFMPQLKRMKDAGVRVYVGGGEGGKALEQYGKPDWVTHNFTAGGTVLNALGSEPVPYLVALRAAAMKKK